MYHAPLKTQKSFATPSADMHCSYVSRDTLQAFGSAVHILSRPERKKAYYYLITLDFEKNQLEINDYDSNNISQAMSDYRKAESSALETETQLDTVLVSAESINAVKQSYPNYLFDTARFAKELDEATS